MWTVGATADIEKVVGFDFPGDFKLELTLRCEGTPVLGFIFDWDKKVFGAYIRGTHKGLDVDVVLALPGTDPFAWSGKIFEGGTMEPHKFDFDLDDP